jgi:hypothetical protein
MGVPRVYRWALLVLVIAAPGARAQSAAAADLEGMVTDSAGGVIPQASVVITNKETGVRHSGSTNELGRYRIASLQVGEYSMRVSKQGFATVDRAGLQLHVGQLATVNIELPVAAQVQKVEVSVDAPIVETARVALGAVVNRTEIDNLPINGRNFLDYSRTVAGVTEQQTSGQGSGLSFNGQRARSNNISVDGADNNGQLNGNTRMTMSQDAVQEFQVVTNQFAPEFGQAGGGLVNVVSRSGSNNLHGSVFWYQRDEALDARNAFVTGEEKPPFRRKNVGASLGGPLKANKTFYFASVEYVPRHESDVVTIAGSDLKAINQVLAQRPIPGSSVKQLSNGSFSIDNIATMASFKLDHTIDQSNSVMFRYIYGQDRESNGGGIGIGGLSDVSGGGGQRERDQSFLLTFNHIFSPALLSESRYQYAPRNLMQYANDPVGPRISISGVATWGRDTNTPVLLDETRHQWTESLSWQHGRHYFKFGADITRLLAHSSYPSTFGGSFSFASLPDFVAGRVNTFSQGFGNPEMDLPDNLLAFYAQDTFRVNQKLTINYGLRYDYDMQPQNIKRDLTNPIEAVVQSGIHRDGNNFAPRAGIAYNPDGAGRLVIRAGYGIYYDKIFLLVARNSLIARQTLQLASAQATAQFVLGAFPESVRFPSGQALPKGSLNTVDPGIVIPYGQQANFGLERSFGHDWAVSANYIMVKGTHLLRSRQTNLYPGTVLTPANAAELGVARPNPQQIGRVTYNTTVRPNPNFGSIYSVGSFASSSYHGLQVGLRKQFSHRLNLRLNYTFSKAIDDASDFTQAMAPMDPYNARIDRSLSYEDQRHRLTLAGVWEIPYSGPAKALLRDWSLATTWFYRSGVPGNPVTGADSNLDGNSANDRPFNGVYLMGRNTFTDPGSFTVNLRLARRIRVRERASIQVLVEAFNVENRVNYSSVNHTWGTELQPRSTFGAYTSAGDPRQLQFGIRFEF